MCRNAKCVGSVGKPEEIYACINKKRSSGLTSAQCHKEILGLPETCMILLLLWFSGVSIARVIPIHVLVSLVIRDAKLAACETCVRKTWVFLDSLLATTELLCVKSLGSLILCFLGFPWGIVPKWMPQTKCIPQLEFL